MCYEKLGNKQASRAYQLVLDKYPDQGDIVALARQKLSALSVTKPDEKPNGIVTREVWSPAKDTWAVSPDGRYLIFMDWSVNRLNVHDINTGNNWPVTEKGISKDKWGYPDESIFSHDSKKIAYVWIDGGTTELRIVNLDGSGTRVLCQEPYIQTPYPFEFSQDGKYILACIMDPDTTKVRTQRNQFCRVKVMDGTIETLQYLPNVRIPGHLSFSPDWKYQLHGIDHPDIRLRDIYLRKLDLSLVSKIVEHQANDWYPFWSNDGKYVIFISDRSGSQGLWCQRVINGTASGEPRLIKGNLEEQFSPIGLTRNGSLYYATESGDKDIFSAGIDFKTGNLTFPPTKLSKRFEGKNFHPSYSPDGKYLAYLTSGPDMEWRNMVFVIHNLETGKEYDLKTNLIPCFYQFKRLKLKWSPDSRSLLVHGQIYGNHFQNDRKIGFFLVDINTGEHKLLLDFEEGLLEEMEDYWDAGRYPQYDTSGNSLYYVKEDILDTRRHYYTFVKFDLKTKQKTKIYRSLSRILSTTLSPDGKYLVFSYRQNQDNPNDLWIIPTSGGIPQKVGSLPNNEIIVSAVWTPDSRNIVLIAGNSRKIHQFPIDGGQPRILDMSSEIATVGGHLSIHPDGNRIAYTGKLKIGGLQVWAIDNFHPKK